MIDQRAAALERQLDAERSSGGGSHHAATNGGGRGQVAIQFFEKRRRKAWLSRGDEEVCWESWTLKVTVAEPRTESGMCFFNLRIFFLFAMGNGLQSKSSPLPTLYVGLINEQRPANKSL